MSVSSIYGDFELNRYPDCVATSFDSTRQKITAIYKDHRWWCLKFVLQYTVFNLKTCKEKVINYTLSWFLSYSSLYFWDVQNVRRVGKNASFLFHASRINGLEVVTPHSLPSSQFQQPHLDAFSQGIKNVTIPVGSFLTCSEVLNGVAVVRAVYWSKISSYDPKSAH